MAGISGSCYKNERDLDFSISLLATQHLLFEVNNMCVAFEQMLRNLCTFHLKPCTLS